MAGNYTITYAAFMRTGNNCNGEKSKVNINGNCEINISADDNPTPGQTGTRKTEALFIDGPADVTADAAITIGANKSGETMEMRKLIIYLSKVLDTAPDNIVEKLGKELQGDFEIYAVRDLLECDLDELDKYLKTVKKNQKKKLLRHLKEMS